MTLSFRLVDIDLDRPRYRFTGMYQVNPCLALGIEANPSANEVGPLLNYMIQPETESLPMMNFGTSSDRIGTPAGPRSYYVTFAKTVGTHLLPYVSLNYSEFEDGLNFPFGVSIFLNQNWVLLPMNDGRKSHLMLTYRGGSSSVSFIWVWFKHPGISFSWQF